MSSAALLYRDNNSAYYSFTPRSSDVLVAEVNFGADTVISLAGQNSTLNGITYGYASGNLSFEANVYGGVSNPGEFYLTGTSLTTHSGGAVNYHPIIRHGFSPIGYHRFSAIECHRFSAIGYQWFSPIGCYPPAGCGLPVFSS